MCVSGILLHALGARFGVNQRLENGQNVAAVIDHAREDIAQRRVALGFAMPLQQHRGRNLDIPAKLFGGMSAQEQAVKESRLPLREVEVVLGFLRRVGGGRKVVLVTVCISVQRQKGKFTGSFPGVKWNGRKVSLL